ncbi:MAG TPA: glycosyltransferase family 39 protein, partial [Chthoniobacterales bacterium]|nr:glycosyltransferase family 39 protein [Chthoniobacterales bacterium]
VFGDNDFAARFPSAVAAALTALLIFAWGRRIANERLGWWAAIMFTVCLQSFIHGKAAVADMWLVLFVTAAHWAGYELLRDQLASRSSQPSTLSSRWWWVFYLSLGFGFLAKGPIAWTPLLALAVTKWFVPDLRLKPRFLFATGLAVSISLISIWAVPALVRTNGEFLQVGIGKHVVERSVIAMEGHGAQSLLGYVVSLPFYFVAIFVTFFPWSLKLPWLGKRLWRNRDPLDNYLLAGTGVVFLLFSLVKTKLPHYTLPAYPLLALLLARALLEQPGSSQFVKRAASSGVALALVAVLVSPWAARFFPAYDLAGQARADLRPEMDFGAVRYREPSLVWYFRRHVRGWFEEVDERFVPEFMARPGPRFVVLPSRQADEAFSTTPSGWKRYRTRGFNTANLKAVDLTLLLKPE